MDSLPTVLFVDDVPLFRELGSIFLSRHARVLTAASGESALEQVRQEQPELVVLDLHLPDLDGSLVCREIACAPRSAETRIIALTNGSPEDHAAAVRAGADDVVSKPLCRDTLVDSVRRFLRGPGTRGLPRVDVNMPVRLWTPSKEVIGTVRNVSRGGLFIESEWFPPADTEMHLSFEVGRARTELCPTAKLIWRRIRAGAGWRGMGVRFLALDRDAATQLDTFVNENAEEDARREEPRAVAGAVG